MRCALILLLNAVTCELQAKELRPCELPPKAAFYDDVRSLHATPESDRSRNWQVHNQYWGRLFDAAYSYAEETCDWSASGCMGAIYDAEFKVQRHRNNSRGWAPISRGVHGSTTNTLLHVDQALKLPMRMRIARTALLMDTVAEYLPADVEVLVETGSGWSRNLRQLVSSSVLRPFPRLKLYALEFSEGGRAVCGLFSHLISRLRAHTIWPVHCDAFNYLKPDYAAIYSRHRKRLGSAVAFTAHSIEQVELMPDAYLLETLRLADRVVGMHFEPVTWQLSPEDLKRQGTAAVRLAEQYVGMQKNHAALGGWIDRKASPYNKNFVRLLKSAEARGLLRIIEMLPNFATPPRNGYAFIRWQKIREPLLGATSIDTA